MSYDITEYVVGQIFYDLQIGEKKWQMEKLIHLTSALHNIIMTLS